MRTSPISKAVSILAVGAVWAGIASQESSAISLIFDSYDLADINAGEDLRRGKVQVIGNILENQGFTLYLPESEFAALSNPTTANDGWDLLVVQPDPVLGDGFFDGLNLLLLADVADLFCFDFVFAGQGAPSGAYPFEFYEAGTVFQIISEGQSVPVPRVPEGGSMALLLGFSSVGLFGFFRKNRA